MTTCLGMEKVKKAEEETAFIANGDKLLQKLISMYDGKCNPIRSYTAEELKIATDNYDSLRILTSDSGYKLYKGFLRGRHVSVKKFNDNPEQYEYCFNDAVHASKMSVHKNFLKLIGCCLETHVPILVFEHAGDCTLEGHLYGPKAHLRPLLWANRLKIALDIAHAVAYLHSAFSRPIVFRNVKPLNIFLDEYGVAKLSDFSISISIPKDKTHVRDLLLGAVGLIAPEYSVTGFFNEKQDVFNFGVFLLMLLTGKMVIDHVSRPVEERYLVTHVRKYIEDDRLIEVMDSIIVGEGLWAGRERDLQDFTMLAFRCISVSPGERPTMVHVSKELKQLCDSAASPA